MRVEMYASDWIFGLFASVIPLEQMGAFFTEFFIHKWHFFYQLILQILKTLEKELLQEDELWNILNQIKSQTFQNLAAIGPNGYSPGGAKRNRLVGVSQVSSPGTAEKKFVNSPTSSQQEPKSPTHVLISPRLKEEGRVLDLLRRIFFRKENTSSSDEELS
jgi:hypothetical protein